MGNSQISLREIILVLKRRKMLLIIPPVVVTILCVGAAIVLPRLYESSIRILVQSSEVQNPLANLEKAMTDGSDDPLKILDDIVYSQKTIGQLIDSLHLAENIHNEAASRALQVKVRSNIQLKVEPRESFTITYYANDPVSAQRGATILANIFIQTVSAAKNQKNELTVEFYKSKLAEFQQKLEESQQQMVARMRENSDVAPSGSVFLYGRLDQIDQQILELDSRQRENEKSLASTVALSRQISTKTGREGLFELQRSQVPYATELRSLLASYEDVLTKYTSKHPEAVELERQIADLLDRIGLALNGEISREKSQLIDLHANREKTMNQILSSSIEQQEGKDKETNYSVYQKLYDEMKVKLEEAQISLAIDRTADSRYTIIDPALVPLYPSKPSRVMIVGGGFVLGAVLGLIAVIISELLDTTIRTPGEIIVFHKPIIGLLPEARKRSNADAVR